MDLPQMPFRVRLPLSPCQTDDAALLYPFFCAIAESRTTGDSARRVHGALRVVQSAQINRKTGAGSL